MKQKKAKNKCQNYTHINAVKEATGIEKRKIIPLIVFADKTNLKVESSSPVINCRNLLFAIRYFKKERLSKDEIEMSVKTMEKSMVNSEKIFDLHNRVIKARETEECAKVWVNICPKCGSKLIIRNGRYGKFIGCSNYPKYKFTAKKTNEGN